MKRVLFILLTAFLKTTTFAQAPNSLAFPSANNSFLGVTGGSTGANVDLYTGSAQVNVPICNLASKELSIPISLSYTGGRGIKLQEYAGSVGLGWQLNAGGGISRVVRGFPDEFPQGYLGTGLWGQQVANAMNNNAPLPNQVTGYNGGASYGNPTADGEPDIFYVKTPFFAFQFTFDEFGNAVVSNNNGIRVTPHNFYSSYSYYNASFSVVDDQGNEYYFGSTSSSVEITNTKLYGTIYSFPTTWYLDKIVTFNSRDVITFSYISSPSNEVTQHYTTVRNYLYNGCTSTKTDSVTNSVSGRYVSAITSSLGSVEFTYAFDRRDIANAGRLTRVKLKSLNPSSSSTDLQTYELKQSYFGDPTTDVNLLRLRLDRITVAGNTPSTSTAVDYKKFTYEQSENLPSRKSQSFDYWGYYNHPWRVPLANDGDPMADPTLRHPAIYRAKANVLTGIKDMSGAAWELEYELNNYFRSSDNTNVAVGGLRVKTLSQKLATGENLQTKYYYTDVNGNSSGQILTESYRNLVWIWPYYVSQVLSEAPSNIYDLNGNFVGYSRVKVVQPNGGYTVASFSNFSDHPDQRTYYNNTFDPNTAPNVTSTTSKAYKRGLLTKQEVYTSTDKKLSEEEHTYTSLTSPTLKKSWAFKWYTASYNFCNVGGSNSSSTTYSSLVENFRPSQSVYRDYDQNNPNSVVQRTAYYAYADNKRLVKSITTSSSQDPNNFNNTQTFYYADDPSIPMLTFGEQVAIGKMVNANRTGVLVHQTNYNGGAITQVHNVYSTSPADGNKVFLNNTDFYKGSSLAKQQFFTYDDVKSNVISSNADGGKSTAALYGYGASYPVAQVTNAGSTNSYTQGTDYGQMYLNGATSASFHVGYTGTISLLFTFGGYPGSNTSATINYTLSGPSPASGSLCISFSGGSCGYSATADFTNRQPGNYTLSYYVVSNNTINPPYLRYTYPKIIPTITSEFFYEGFEDLSYASFGDAHTGKAYYNASSSPYQVNYSLPNGRSYVIQWWSLQGGKWIMHEEPYTGPRSLSGIIDDIRIFPSDAQMTTFTYDRLVGKTGEIDASGRTTTYEYDGMGRTHIVRDNDRNIVSVTCYSVQGKQVNCKLYTNQDMSDYYYSQNCPPGQTPDPYYVSVPAGMFTSYSQEDANAMGTQYGQAQANQFGTCHTSDFGLYVSNNSWYSYTIELYNVNTGQQYWFYVNPYESNIVGYIPEGTYDVYLSSSDYSYRSYNAGCFYYTSGYGYATFYSVPLNPSCNSISIN